MTILNSAEPMQHNNPSLNKSTDADWQILGKLELPVGSMADLTINTWLMKTLNALNLQSDFLNKVLKSAQDAAGAVQNGMEFEHIHLLVFAPVDRTSIGKTWGFFRIEKIESAGQDKNPPDQSIEFYLYIEGK